MFEFLFKYPWTAFSKGHLVWLGFGPAWVLPLAIVLGANSEVARANEAQKLLNWGYTAFEDVKLFDANQPVVTPEVWKGTVKTAKLGDHASLRASQSFQLAARIMPAEQVAAAHALHVALAGHLLASFSDAQAIDHERRRGGRLSRTCWLRKRPRRYREQAD